VFPKSRDSRQQPPMARAPQHIAMLSPIQHASVRKDSAVPPPTSPDAAVSPRRRDAGSGSRDAAAKRNSGGRWDYVFKSPQSTARDGPGLPLDLFGSNAMPSQSSGGDGD
jgi:hypothetical protein